MCLDGFKLNTNLSIIIYFTSKVFSVETLVVQYHCCILLCLWLLSPKRKLASFNPWINIKKRRHGAIFFKNLKPEFFCFNYISSITLYFSQPFPSIPAYSLLHLVFLLSGAPPWYRRGNENPPFISWKEAWNILFLYARKWTWCILPKTWNKVFQVLIHAKNRLP